MLSKSMEKARPASTQEVIIEKSRSPAKEFQIKTHNQSLRQSLEKKKPIKVVDMKPSAKLSLDSFSKFDLRKVEIIESPKPSKQVPQVTLKTPVQHKVYGLSTSKKQLDRPVKKQVQSTKRINAPTKSSTVNVQRVAVTKRQTSSISLINKLQN